MNKKECYKLMNLIQVYYEKFQFDQHKLDAWYMVLQKYSYDNVQKNLLKFVGEFPHPPKISDLVHNSQGRRYIPKTFVLDLTAGEEDR
ncbi:replicative helicase loader/inhibitor [Bacillus sp. USDA818B3_A]|uniref:replicative helicase loader/inhibitor n=1 Tax=Bacillus sp. USDA818B3_A TaxID=2698834 RepID=UPI001369C13E|nr:replicative helicase loader/inhibitor [Bacillus sp. USDA818B3_A]